MYENSTASLLQSLFLASQLLGCGSITAPLDHAGTTALVDRATKHEAVGDLEAATDDYLLCLQWCSVTVRPWAASRLREVSMRVPRAEAAVWRIAEELEAGATSASTASPALRADVNALRAIYRAWGRPERAMALLSSVQSAAPVPVAEAVLDELAAFYPEAFRTMSDRDAHFLLERVARAPREDRDHLSRFPSRPGDAEMFEQVRLTTALGYAAALLTAKRDGEAQEVVRLARAGLAEPGCEKLVAEVLVQEHAGLRTLACQECSGAHGCEEGPPAEQ